MLTISPAAQPGANADITSMSALTGIITNTQDALGTTTASALRAINTTAAANGAQQCSPSIRWRGQGWMSDSSQSQTDEFRAYCLPVQGTSVSTATWLLQSNINGGAFSTVLTVASSGTLTGGADIIATNRLFAGASQTIGWNTRGALACSNSNGTIELYNSTNSGFTQLNFGGVTSNFNAITRDAVNGFTLKAADGNSTWNDNNTPTSGTVANRYLWGTVTPTLTATNATVTYTVASTIYIAGAPIASSLTIGTAYALFVDTGITRLDDGLVVGGTTINANSLLDIQSTTKAFMPPRMTTTQKSAIASPTSGMVVYDSTLQKLCVFGAATWETITSV